VDNLELKAALIDLDLLGGLVGQELVEVAHCLALLLHLLGQVGVVEESSLEMAALLVQHLEADVGGLVGGGELEGVGLDAEGALSSVHEIWCGETID
jgi:hypothetical protein